MGIELGWGRDGDGDGIGMGEGWGWRRDGMGMGCRDFGSQPLAVPCSLCTPLRAVVTYCQGNKNKKIPTPRFAGSHGVRNERSSQASSSRAAG